MTALTPPLKSRATNNHAKRLRNRLFGVLAIWTLVLAALIPATASASASEEASFISQVNATRASVGLPALQTDVQLTNLARSWATSMRDGNCGEGHFICHASPISAGVTHPWAKLGENVGTGPDIGAIMNAFIASPGHYANIVDPEFTHIGVGVVWDGNRMFTTHRFMKLQGAPPTTTAAPPTTVTPTTASPTSTALPAPTPPTTGPTATAPLATTTTSPPAPLPTTTSVAESTSSAAAQSAATRSRDVARRRASVVLKALAKVGPR